MKIFTSGRKLFLLGMASLFLAACAGKTVVESDLRIKGAPDWVNEGSNVLKDRGGRLIHGVGSAPPMGDESLQISSADNRARAEVARILSSFMKVVSKDYINSVQTSEGPAVEAQVSRNIQNITELNMTGVKIIAHWKHRKRHSIYALAELDMEKIKNTMSKVEGMNPGFYEHFNKNGDAVFDRLVKGGI